MDSISLSSLNVVDIVILVIILISILIGFARGFISEAVSLLTLIAAIAVAIAFTNPLANYFMSTATMQDVVTNTTNTIGTSTAQPASYVAIGISFAILFIGTLIIGGIIKLTLNAIFQRGFLGFGNRLLGGVFGFVRGILFVLVLIFLVQLSPLANQPWWKGSKYVPYFEPQVVWLGSIVSPALDNLKATFNSTIQDATGAVNNIGNGVNR